MRPKLRALEKNILKYRALQMVLLLHQVESLKSFVVGSIRATDNFPFVDRPERLPVGEKKILQKCWRILVNEGVITEEDSADIQRIIDIRNQIGHSIHDLVADISAPWYKNNGDPIYDYFALDRFEMYRDKIYQGMGGKFVELISLKSVSFEEAEKTYKEELVRLHRRISKQYADRVLARV